MKYLILLIVVFSWFSCKKDKTLPNESSTEIAIPEEQYIQEFTQYEREFTIDIEGIPLNAATPHIYQSHGFRLIEGQEYNDAYFYSLEKKALFKNNCGDTILSSSWTSVSGYYRYSFEDNISFYYQTMNDPTPVVLFDFNVNVGDTVLLDQSHNIQFVIENVSHQTMQGITFPVVSGQVITYSQSGVPGAYDDVSNSTSGTLSISPFSSNPFWINQNFNQYTGIGWGPSDFCYFYQNFSTIDVVSLKSINLSSNSVFFDFAIEGLSPL